MTRFLFTLVAIASALQSLSASAASFRSTKWYGNLYVITLTGTIHSDDEMAFKKEVLSNLRMGRLVYGVQLYTPGGNVPAALSIGEQIRLLGAFTMSPFKDNSNKVQCLEGEMDRRRWMDGNDCECASACFIIWSSGNGRHGNYVGVHRPYYESNYFKGLTPSQAEDKYTKLDNEVRSYFTKMAIPDWAVNKMFSVSSQSMHYLEASELSQLRNSMPWMDEYLRAKCGSNPGGAYYENPERLKWVNCAVEIWEDVARRAAQKYLDLHGTVGEKIPAGPARTVVSPNVPLTPAPAPTPVPVSPTPAPPTPKPVIPTAPPTSGDRIVFTTGPNEGYYIRDNRDLDGIDLKPYIRNVDQNSCARACTANFQCQAFSYDEWNRLCILKNNIVASRLEPRSISGVSKSIYTKFPAPVPDLAKMEKFPNRYFPGEGYKTETSFDATSCLASCEKDLSCVAFTFFKKQNICRYFKSTSQYFANDAADSGVKIQPK